MDTRGMGVRNKIVRLLLEQNGIEPKLLATENHLRLILYCGLVQSET